tara:strand:+ start:106 stop:1134 length:1029 start_codon:yes stop_codon:yes gene_type:complete
MIIQSEQIYLIIFFLFLNFAIFYNLKLISTLINIYDYPDKKRKIHKFATPLLGGIFFYINSVLFIIYSILLENNVNLLFNLSLESFLVFFIAFTSIFVIGLIDDKYSISANKKFILIFFIVLVTILLVDDLQIKSIKFSFLSFEYDMGILSIPFTVLSILLFINAINMFDGINTQIASYIIFILIYFLSNSIEPLYSLTLLFYLLYFLLFNSKDKIFMGDSGTLPISFLLSIIFINSYNQNLILFADEIYILMAIPGLELIRLFIIRAYKKRNPFSADRNHIHHYLTSIYPLSKSIALLMTLVFLPFLMGLYMQNYLTSIFLSFFLYSTLILYLMKRSQNDE